MKVEELGSETSEEEQNMNTYHMNEQQSVPSGDNLLLKCRKAIESLHEEIEEERDMRMELDETR